jgi:poly-gamma-glutamate capsule biosynthesis protein CapA/YwtB (metallophosphatase superfamily)
VVDRRTRLIPTIVALVLLCESFGTHDSAALVKETPAPQEAVTVLFAGDAMLGRGIAPLVASDPDSLFADVRREIRRADLAAVNVESPLTNLPHDSPNPYALEADPETAKLLASAGFDVAGVANNHAGDAGEQSILDSITAVEQAGMIAIGVGATIADAWEPAIVDVEGVRIAFLAIDGSGQGVAATRDQPGIASWDEAAAHTAIQHARTLSDIVTVGLHGGIEYWDESDPLLTPIALQLAEWGVDVVWGHGPHVGQPAFVVDPDDDGRRTVIVTSLGNLLFDQQTPATSDGLLLEVLVDRDGLVAHRVGSKHHDDLRVHFTGWYAPDGDAALIDGEWWSLDRSPILVDTSFHLEQFTEGTVINAGRSDLDGDGHEETLVSYRHSLRISRSDAQSPPPVDSDRRSAHLGVLDEEGTPLWLSRRPPHPIGRVAACDGAAAFAYTTLDNETVAATGAGIWSGFGFILDTELPGPGTIGCADINGDGTLDPVVDRQSTYPTSTASARPISP